VPRPLPLVLNRVIPLLGGNCFLLVFSSSKLLDGRTFGHFFPEAGETRRKVPVDDGVDVFSIVFPPTLSGRCRHLLLHIQQTPTLTVR
jgi:hypothetical protein